MGKSSLEFLDAKGMKKALHQPYSLDLAPADFLLFGEVKRKSVRSSFENPDELLLTIETILSNIDNSALIAAD
jgi:hypothetical protein